MYDGMTMRPSDELRDAIQVGLIDPIRRSFVKQQQTLTSLDKMVRALLAAVVINVVVTVALMAYLIATHGN